MESKNRVLLAVIFVLMLWNTNAQQYDYEPQEHNQDYTQDSLYYDYAMKQQEKDVGKA